MEKLHKILFYKNYKFSFLTRNGGVSKNSFESLNCSFNKGDTIESVKKNKALVQRIFCPKKKSPDGVTLFSNSIQNSFMMTTFIRFLNLGNINAPVNILIA